MVDIVGLPGLFDALLDASWRGVTFTMPDSRQEVGRRAIRFFFPGSDATVIQDLGAKDGPIRISGILIGDDWTEQARRMQAALRQPGPGTLFHPWLGEVQAWLIEPASVSQDVQKGRVATFEAVFLLDIPPALAAPDTLSLVLDALADARAQARALLRAVLAPVVLTLAVVGYVQRYAALMASYYNQLTGGVPTVAAAAAVPVAALSTIGAVAPGVAYPDGVADILAGPSVAIAASSAVLAPAAVGPGTAPIATTPVDGRVTAGLLLTAATDAAASATGVWPAPALTLAQQTLILADAIDAATEIQFDSQQEAVYWRDKLLAAIDAAALAAANVAATQPVAGGLVWASLTTMRAGVAADMNARIGRLPAVATITTTTPMPAWLIANAIAGDDPTQILPTLLDIVKRNKVIHPGRVPAGVIEYLVRK